jgi:3-hydroxyisobutyrate dehydrogenase-like beta-hydroxyacid dehydrogenase
MSATRIGVIGLGEAGRMLASSLAASADVRGWDPAPVDPITGVRVCTTASDAVSGAELVLAVTSAKHAVSAQSAALPSMLPGAIYADCATAGPTLKRRLANTATEAGVLFADVAIMAPVRRGPSATPMVMSGPGAHHAAELLTTHGLAAEAIDGAAGAAAARKLLRSMLIKGVTGVMIETLRTAEAEGLLPWFHDHLLDALSSQTPESLQGLLDGTVIHSIRRVDEMDAARQMAQEAGQDAQITTAVADLLRTVPQRGIPPVGLPT